jgi:hypothetical protein
LGTAGLELDTYEKVHVLPVSVGKYSVAAERTAGAMQRRRIIFIF